MGGVVVPPLDQFWGSFSRVQVACVESLTIQSMLQRIENEQQCARYYAAVPRPTRPQ